VESVLFVVILLGAVVLFLTRALPFEATAALIIASLVLSGILSPPEALSGFSNPAVITIAGMYVLSAGLIRRGGPSTVGSVGPALPTTRKSARSAPKARRRTSRSGRTGRSCSSSCRSGSRSARWLCAPS
jgi:hypothetical protein